MFYSTDTLLFILGTISILIWLNTAIKDFKKGTYNLFGYNHSFEFILVAIIIFPLYFIENEFYGNIYSTLIISIMLITQTFFCAKMYLRGKKLKYLLTSVFLIVIYFVLLIRFIKFLITY